MADKLRDIKRSLEHEDFVQKLGVRSHPIKKRSIFPTIKDLLCFAAMLGFSEQKRVPFSPNFKTDEIQRQIFFNDNKINLIYLIALAETKNANVLRNDEPTDIVNIFEEYANGGLELMKSWELDVPDDPNGDKAIVNGLIKNKYLSLIKDESDTPVEF
jgi:dnd system-associated protein 4